MTLDESYAHFNTMEQNHEVKVFNKIDRNFVIDPHYVIAKQDKDGTDTYFCARTSACYPYEDIVSVYWSKNFSNAKKFAYYEDALGMMHAHDRMCKDAYVYCFQEQEIYHSITKGYKIEK